MLLHMDGADNSTTFTDEKGRAFSVSSGGTVQIKTANKKFGTGSAFFNGSGYISTPNNTDVSNLGTTQFSLDFWFYPTQLGGAYHIMSKGPGLQIYISGSSLVVALSSTNNISYFMNAGITGLAVNNWYHMVLHKTSAGYCVGVNGTGLISADFVNNAIGDGGNALVIGGYAAGTGAAIQNPFIGYIDEVRLVKGQTGFPTMVTYGNTYTVPSAPYTV
jgi:hypothetical protein